MDRRLEISKMMPEMMSVFFMGHLLKIFGISMLMKYESVVNIFFMSFRTGLLLLFFVVHLSSDDRSSSDDK